MTGKILPGDKIPESCHLQLARIQTTNYAEVVDCILYYCKIKKQWYAFNESFAGNTPDNWRKIKEKLDFKTKYQNDGSYFIAYSDGICQRSEVKEINLKPEHYLMILDSNQKTLSIPYDRLVEGVDVLFAVDSIIAAQALTTRGTLHREGNLWYILHNDNQKDGIFPTGGNRHKFKYSWGIGNESTPYDKLIRFEILGEPAKVIPGHRHVSESSELGTPVPRNEQAELLMMLGEI